MYKEIFKRTLDLLVAKKNILIKALIVPFIILTIIENYLPTDIRSITLGVDNNISNSLPLLLILLSFLISVLMSITVHRILLLPEDKTPTFGILTLSKRELTFMLKVIYMTIFLVLFALILYVGLLFLAKAIFDALFGSFIANIFATASIVFIGISVLVLFSRMSLTFPTIAVDKPIGLFDSLNLTKNHKTLVFFTVVVIPLILATLLGFVYGLAIEFLMALISQKLSVLYSLLNVFITVLIIAFISVTYEYLINHQPIKEEKPINEPEITKTDNSFKISIDERYDLTFESLKEELFNQYSKIGFENITIDKPSSWMIKSSESNESYILLSHKDNFYEVETFNVEEEPILDIKRL
ncbi:MAG: hypothetical protein HWD90_02150 [Campylobacteraceae bacterium]|nr:hypothetical protein [Campylobacteraceae bacterium]